MPAGAPRTVSFSVDEMIELGEEMVEWVTINNPLHLSEWYTIEKMFTYKQWKTFIQRDEFVPYYERSLKIVGRNYLSKTSDVEPSIKQRWQRVYFADIKEQENEDKEFEANLDKQVQESVQSQVLEAYDAHRKQLQSIRELYDACSVDSKSDLIDADNTNNTDNISA